MWPWGELRAAKKFLEVLTDDVRRKRLELSALDTTEATAYLRKELDEAHAREAALFGRQDGVTPCPECGITPEVVALRVSEAREYGSKAEVERARNAELRVEELESPLKSRKLKEAPKDGTDIIVRLDGGLAIVEWVNHWSGSGWFHIDASEAVHPDTDEWWPVPALSRVSGSDDA